MLGFAGAGQGLLFSGGSRRRAKLGLSRRALCRDNLRAERQRARVCRPPLLQWRAEPRPLKKIILAPLHVRVKEYYFAFEPGLNSRYTLSSMSSKPPATGILELLIPQVIDVDVQATSKNLLLAKMCGTLARAGLVVDELAVLQAVVERENIASTGCGCGVAVPHARVKGAERMAMALGLCKAGVEFDAVDNQPVKIVFLVVAPQNSSEAYLRLLSQIAQWIRDKDFREALLSCDTPIAVMELFRGI